MKLNKRITNTVLTGILLASLVLFVPSIVMAGSKQSKYPATGESVATGEKPTKAATGEVLPKPTKKPAISPSPTVKSLH